MPRTPLPPRPLDPKTARLRAAREARDAQIPPLPRCESHRMVIGLRDELTFGKYEGSTIEDVLDADLGYVTWLLEETDVVLSDDAELEYQSRLDPRRPRTV